MSKIRDALNRAHRVESAAMGDMLHALFCGGLTRTRMVGWAAALREAAAVIEDVTPPPKTAPAAEQEKPE